MILAEATWKEVQGLSREAVCLIPTGSLEQHGPHLPLLTDTILSTFVSSGAERLVPEITLLYPGIWLGCSSHHMAMTGTATASAKTYIAVLTELIESAIHHGFRKMFVLNGHGGNTEPNGIALRELKDKHPNLTFAHCGYFSLIPPELLESTMQGPFKHIRHACEAEASMMLHAAPSLVRKQLLRDDVLAMQPAAPAGLNYIQPFHEISEEGSVGYAKLASAEKGKTLLDSAIQKTAEAIQHIHAGYIMQSVIKTP